jgi:hypothetical protein
LAAQLKLNAVNKQATSGYLSPVLFGKFTINNRLTFREMQLNGLIDARKSNRKFSHFTPPAATNERFNFDLI